MAQITLTIPDAVVDRVIKAMCGANGLSVSAANAKLTLINHIKSTTIYQESLVKEAEANNQIKLVLDTKASAVATVDSEIQAISIV